jgi:hypothetical protein
MGISDNIPNVIFMVLVLVAGCAYLWKLYKDSENDSKCPNCGELWAAQKVNEKILGIFQKASPFSFLYKLFVFDRREKMIVYEKYEIQRRCKFCGHEWISVKSIKQ